MTAQLDKVVRQEYLEKQVLATIYKFDQSKQSCTLIELKKAVNDDLTEARKENPEVPELVKDELEKLLSSLSGRGLLGTKTETNYVIPSTREIRRTYENYARLSTLLWQHYRKSRR